MNMTLIAALVIISPFAFALLLIYMLMDKKDNSGQGVRKITEEDARIMQVIFDGLRRMEGRVESLETLLLEKERAES